MALNFAHVLLRAPKIAFPSDPDSKSKLLTECKRMILLFAYIARCNGCSDRKQTGPLLDIWLYIPKQ